MTEDYCSFREALEYGRRRMMAREARRLKWAKVVEIAGYAMGIIGVCVGAWCLGHLEKLIFAIVTGRAV